MKPKFVQLLASTVRQMNFETDQKKVNYTPEYKQNIMELDIIRKRIKSSINLIYIVGDELLILIVILQFKLFIFHDRMKGTIFFMT